MIRNIEIKKIDREGNITWIKTQGIFSDKQICALPGCNRKVSGNHRTCSQVHHMKYLRMKKK